MSTAATHAKGLEGVVAAETRLSDVRGEEGVLIYAGYDINELAGKTTFEEVVHLLHENRLPNRKELDALKRTLAAYRTLPPKVVDILRALPKETPPMHAVRTGISALGCFDPHADNTGPGEHKTQALRLIAQIPVITAFFIGCAAGKTLSSRIRVWAKRRIFSGCSTARNRVARKRTRWTSVMSCTRTTA